MKLITTTAALLAGIALAGCGSGSGTTYKARIQNRAVISPADLAVTVRVTNTGKQPGEPDCTVTATDPSGAYSGSDEETDKKPLKPGASVVYVDNVLITAQGARYVTSVKVSCQ